MATGIDLFVGYGMMSAGLLIFTYYTLWVIVLPFVDATHMIHIYFPPRIYAIIIPVVAGVAALTVVGAFIAFVLISSKTKKKQS